MRASRFPVAGLILALVAPACAGRPSEGTANAAAARTGKAAVAAPLHFIENDPSTALAEAKRRKVEVLWLDVRITNVPAIELFQKLGFRTWGIFPNRIKTGREYLDVLYMACDLRTSYHPLRDLP